MSDITFELFEIEADETSVLECKFGQYIIGEQGEKGDKGNQGDQGTLTDDDTALLASYTSQAAASAGKAKTSEQNAANSATQAQATADQAKTQTQQAVTDAQAAATAADTSRTQAVASATAASGSQTAAAASATQANASATSASASSNNAQDWAVKMNGLVQNTDYSAKYYASQSATSASAASASKDAANTSAGQAATSATNAAGSATAAAGSASDAAGSAASINPAALVPIDGSRAMTAPLKTTGLALQGTSNRITGDMTASTQKARLQFQTSTANTSTLVGAMPSGSGTMAGFNVFSASDPDNAIMGQLAAWPTDVRLVSSWTGTGTAKPLLFYTGGVVQYTIDAAGNHTFAGNSATFAHNTVNFNGASQSILGFQKAGVLRYALGWDGTNFTCNRYNASGAYVSTGWYVRDSDGALITGASASVTGGLTVGTSITMLGTLTNTGNAIELGPPAAAGPAYIDFHSSGNAVDYDSRIIATAGTAAAGNGTVEFYGGTFNFRPTNNYLNVITSSTYSVLKLQAGSYGPTMRASSGNTAMEFVNSANTAVNLTIGDNGGVAARGVVSGVGVNCSGTLWMQGANSIRLDGGSYSGFLRGDSTGLVGFINQAQNNWTLQIKDAGYVKAMNGFIWGDESNIAGQWNGTGSVGGHTESNAIVQCSNNVNLLLGHTGAGGTQIGFYVVGASVGSISSSTTATSYNTTSDYRLKTNIEDLAGGLDRVLQMRPVAFDWKASGEPARGFIAHELEPIEPDAVTGVKDAMAHDDRGAPDAPDVPVYQQVDLSFCIPDMVAAMKELKSQLDAALARIAALESPAPAP